MNEEKWVRKM